MNYIWLKLIKDWGSHQEGDIVKFGESKGRPLIEKGTAIEVDAPVAVPETAPVVETATVTVVAETAEVMPPISTEVVKKNKSRQRG